MAVLEMRNPERVCLECPKKDDEIERLEAKLSRFSELQYKRLDDARASRLVERGFWEQNIKDEALRAGLDPSGTIGCATLHMLGEEIAQLNKALETNLDKILDQTNKQVDAATRREGYVAGLRAFAWWKDGVEYVGTNGKTLAEAIDEDEQ